LRPQKITLLTEIFGKYSAFPDKKRFLHLCPIPSKRRREKMLNP
jgi:hypothetical protein